MSTRASTGGASEGNPSKGETEKCSTQRLAQRRTSLNFLPFLVAHGASFNGLNAAPKATTLGGLCSPRDNPQQHHVQEMSPSTKGLDTRLST